MHTTSLEAVPLPQSRAFGFEYAARYRERAQPRTLRPFGAPPAGSSEPQGGPHVRHSVLNAASVIAGAGARPFGVGRSRPVDRRAATGSRERKPSPSGSSSERTGGVGQASAVPWSSELVSDGASSLFGGTLRGEWSALMSSKG